MNRIIYEESTDPYYRARGASAAAAEHLRREQRLRRAHLAGISWQHADIAYLLQRRKEMLGRWFTLLKWLRRGMLASGDPRPRALLHDLRMESEGARVQTHRAVADDCQAAHLMPCGLRFRALGSECPSMRFLMGGSDAVRDYRAFTSNIFAATANVMSIVNEIDSYLESHGATGYLVDASTRVMRDGIEPDMALAQFMTRYRDLIGVSRDAYLPVIERYYAGDASVEGRIAKGQHLSAALKKHRKRDLFQVCMEAVDTVPGLSTEMQNMLNRAYERRHLEWGRARTRI